MQTQWNKVDGQIIINLPSIYQRFLFTGIHPSFFEARHSSAPIDPVKTDQRSQRLIRARQSLKSNRVVPA